MTDGVALYVHVPWCRHVCPYCDFNVYAGSNPPQDDYTTALAHELAVWSTTPPFAGRRVASVYVGGGTPSLFTPAAIARVLDAAGRHFGLAPDPEVTLEANPGTVTTATLRGYREAGVNRVSLGVQSFEPRLLQVLGRDHTPRDSQAAVVAAREAGFANVSLDLIFGAPGSTPADWERDLDRAVALDPSHVSAYALTFEERTPYHAWRTTGRIRAVDEDDEATMAEHTAERLPAAGYARYEISSWARPGYASAHNQRYWDGSSYLGVGAGAHSFDATPTASRRWSNLRLPRAYMEAVAARGTAVADEQRLDVAQARGDFVFTGLRRIAGVDETAFVDRFGLSLVDAFPHVTGLLRDGLVERTGRRLRLSTRGLRFADTVAATFV
jgi:putative oxygen-independent coproporphyrinogen III oxidase